VYNDELSLKFVVVAGVVVAVVGLFAAAVGVELIHRS